MLYIAGIEQAPWYNMQFLEKKKRKKPYKSEQYRRSRKLCRPIYALEIINELAYVPGDVMAPIYGLVLGAVGTVAPFLQVSCYTGCF